MEETPPSRSLTFAGKIREHRNILDVKSKIVLPHCPLRSAGRDRYCILNDLSQLISVPLVDWQHSSSNLSTGQKQSSTGTNCPVTHGPLSQLQSRRLSRHSAVHQFSLRLDLIDSDDDIGSPLKLAKASLGSDAMAASTPRSVENDLRTPY